MGRGHTGQCRSSEILFDRWLDLFFCLCGAGLVGVLGLAGSLEGGLVAALGADFAVGGFAGAGAGAVVAGFMDTHGGLGPMFGLFHVISIASPPRSEKEVITLYRAMLTLGHDARR